MNENKVAKYCRGVSAIILLGSIILLFPQIRQMIVSFCEQYILHRELQNHAKWMRFLLFLAGAGIVVAVALSVFTVKNYFLSDRSRRLLMYTSAAVLFLCLLIFLPFIRAAIISFAERFIAGRIIDEPGWDYQLVKLACFGTFLSILALFYALYEVSKKVPEKKTFYCSVIQFFLIGLFTFLTSILVFTNNAIWLDEAYCLAPIRHSIIDIISFQRTDTNPPLYNIMIKVWSLFFGQNVYAIKLFSIIPTVLTMLLVSSFLQKNVSERSAVLFLLCFLASDTIYHYSIEIKGYSWVFFYVTASAVSLWYILTTEKNKWFIFFLLFAECAAYTHFYAAAYIAIEYVLALVYVIYSKDRNKIFKFLLIIPCAVILFIPWLPVVLNGISNTNTIDLFWWIPNLTYPILQSYFSELFRTYNKVTTGFFVFMFEVAIGYFFIKSHRSKNEIFSFACLFSLLFFVIAALILAPIKKIPLIPRYMFPAYGLCLLFFAIEFESIERVKVLKTVCTILIAFCFLTFPEFYRSEAQEAREFNKFFNYMAEKDSPDDIFIRTNQDNISGWHHTNIINYFYPNRVFANTGTGLLGLEREVITYDDLFNNSKYTNRGAWIIIPGESVMDDSELESSVEFCGVYSVSHNTLTLYHAKRASDAKNLISLVDKSVNR